MCKVLIIPRISDDTRELILDFTTRMARKMSASNSDGLGYAAVKKDGSLYGERWLKNSDFWMPPADPQPDHVARLFSDSLTSYRYANENYGEGTVAGDYNRFGEGTIEDAAAITLHARMATSTKGMVNTHPFVYADQDTSLIHNGVIRNTEDFKFNVSTCDSEAILMSYLKHGVNNESTKVADMAKDLVGYYVAAVFSRDAEGRRILDIAKAHNNNLTVAWVPDFNTYVIATSSHDIQSTLNEMGIDRVGMADFKDGIMLRINPINGDIIERITFTPGAATQTRTYTPLTVAPARTYSERNHTTPGNRDNVIAMGRNLSADLMEYMRLKPEIQQLPSTIAGA